WCRERRVSFRSLVRFERDETNALSRCHFHLMRRSGGDEKIIACPHGHGCAAPDGGAALLARCRLLRVHGASAGDKTRFTFLHEEIVVPVGMDFRLAILVTDGVDDLVAV